MRLVELKFVNHIRFGTLTISTNRELVLFLGANGSGKSFLLSNCHPKASSSRSRTTYPFVPGKAGFIKAVFQDGEVLWECIHELQPKQGGKHACKSYLNKLEGTYREELNPTGHVPRYEELIEKHLHFNRDVPDVGFLSYKNNGITASSPVRRKEVLETTINVETLKKMQKNARENFREYKTALKLQENRKVQLLQHGTIQQLEEKEQEILQKLETVTQVIRANEARSIALETDLTALETMSVINMIELSTLLKISESVLSPSDIPSEVASQCQSVLRTMDGLGNEIHLLDREIESLQIELESVVRIDTLQTSLSSDLETLNKKRQLSQKYQFQQEIGTALQKLIDISEGLVNIQANIDPDTVMEEMESVRKKQEERIQFLDQYKFYQKLDDGTKYKFQYQPNCNTCELYQKFGVAQEYLEKNENLFLKELKQKVDMEDWLGQAQHMIAIKTIWNTHAEILKRSPILADKCKVNTFQEFFHACKTSNLTNVLRQVLEYLEGLQGEIGLLERTISEKKREIETRTSLLQNKTIQKDVIVERQEKREEKKRQLQSLISDPKQKWYESCKSFVTIYNDTITNYRLRQLEEETKEARLSELRQNKDICRRQLEESRMEQDRWNQKLFLCRSNREQLLTLQKDILEYQDTRDVLEVCVDILEKSIPTTLMEKNLQFIEETTNHMLEENQIPIQIEIVPTESEIRIPVTVHDKTLEDIDMLSTGEQCLISLMMNSCILHILGYPILCLDEIDANLDTKNREKFNNVLYCILETLHIDQIFCISHNVGTSIQNAMKFVIGDPAGLGLPMDECVRI